MYVATKVSRAFACPRERLYDLAVDNRVLARVFTGCGPIPAITSACLEEAETLAEGVLRRVEMSDGSTLKERIVGLRRPELHAYHVLSGFKPPFAWMLVRGESEWRFGEAGPGRSRIDWRYRFLLKSFLFAGVGLPVVKVFMRGAMQRCLANLAELAERP